MGLLPISPLPMETVHYHYQFLIVPFIIFFSWAIKIKTIGDNATHPNEFFFLLFLLLVLVLIWLTLKLLFVKSTPLTNGKTPVLAIVCADCFGCTKYFNQMNCTKGEHFCTYASIECTQTHARIWMCKKKEKKQNNFYFLFIVVENDNNCFNRIYSFEITVCIHSARTIKCFSGRKCAMEFFF